MTPTLPQTDQACLDNVRDLSIDLMKTLQPGTRAMFADQINAVMTHLSGRLEHLHRLEAQEEKRKEGAPE